MGIPIAYSFSPLLRQHTHAIDELRTHILTIPLSPHKEIDLRYHATTERILTALRYAHIPMTATELHRLLMNTPKRAHPMEREALLYRQALWYIRNEWSGSTRAITVSSLEILMNVAFPLTSHRISKAIRDSGPDLKRFIAYSEAQTDHPILLAGVAHAVVANTELTNASSGRMPLLTGSFIMAKYGYDCRGLLNYEQPLIQDPEAYSHALKSISSLGQMTVWLEYFANATLQGYNALVVDIQESVGRKTFGARSNSALNERQKEIILLLDSPSAKVTNREVQKRFRISQITASRDLSTLVSLGFLISSGKGRSTYYTLA